MIRKHTTILRKPWKSLVAVATTAAFAVLASAATTPSPPPRICIGNNCVQTPTGNIKWNPGHYVWVGGPGYDSRIQANTSAFLSSTAKDPNVAGIQVIFRWAELEGDTPGDYSRGFALLDGLLAKLAARPVPKHLMIGVGDRTFGGGLSSVPAGLYPAYIVNMPNGVAVAPVGSHWAGSLNTMVHMDNPAVVDHFIALIQAYGQRYNSNPLLEMVTPWGESAVSSSAGINGPAFLEQMKRTYAAASQAWPNTLLRWPLNWAGSDQSILSILAFARTLPQSAIGGPDPEVPLPLMSDYPSGVRTIQANQVFRGLSSGSNSAPAYEDLRGKMPWVGEYQGGARIGVGSVLPQDFGNYEINVMHASHLIYMYNTWAPANTPANDPHKWMAQLTYIHSTNGATSLSVTAPVLAAK